MSAIVVKVMKAKNASVSKPFATVRFVTSNVGKSKFGVGAFGTNHIYPLTYDLSAIYTDVKDDDGEFDYEEAYRLFKKEMTGEQEDVNCYDIPLIDVCEYSELKIVANDRIMRSVPVATYGGHDDAVRIVKSGVARQLKNGTLVVIDDKKDGEEED